MMGRYLDLEAEEAYDKFKRSRGILGFTLGKATELKSFQEIQHETKAYNNSYLGIVTVALDKIVGSVGKIEDFDKNFIPRNKIVKIRWCSIYKEMVSNGNLPPIQLYKIRDEYFAYDGNHRISVAKYLNAKSTEAEVTEFFPSTDDPKDVIYWEKFYFYKQTDINEINSDQPGAYERLIRRIQNFEKNVNNFSKEQYNFKEISKIWYNTIYRPTIEILEINGINEETRKEKFGDIFLSFLDFKSYLEEGGKRFFGYCYSLIHDLNESKRNYSRNWKNSIYLDSYLIKLFLGLYKYDVERSLSSERIEKLLYIRNFFNTNISNEIKIVDKMEKYFNENNLFLSPENMILWNKNFLTPHYNLLVSEINKREISCFINNPKLIEDKGRMFLELLAYKKIFEKIYNKKLNELELVLLFILEVAIPLGKVLDEASIPKEELNNIYFLLSKRYAHYLSHNSKISFDSLYKNYDRSSKSSFQEKLKFLIYGKNVDIPETLTELKELLSSTEIKQLNEIMDTYDRTSNYKTEVFLKKLREEFIEENGIVWINKFETDLKSLSENPEVMVNFNTYLLMEFLKDSPYPYTLIDFYVDILNHCSYLGADRQYANIITLAVEYIHSFQYKL